MANKNLRFFFHPWAISCREEKYRFSKEKREREEEEKKVSRAGLKNMAAASSQPACLDVSRSDHSVDSKESALWRVLRQQFGLTRSMGLGRGKEGKEKGKRESSQDEPALEKKERHLKSAKIEIISCIEEI